MTDTNVIISARLTTSKKLTTITRVTILAINFTMVTNFITVTKSSMGRKITMTTVKIRMGTTATAASKKYWPYTIFKNWHTYVLKLISWHTYNFIGGTHMRSQELAHLLKIKTHISSRLKG